MIGKTLGHYKVGEQLGRGGMGEVYVADDPNLNRKVALKFLPDAFTGDPERMARFEREAKLLASLNHPNIAAIYGLEQAEGKRFLVLELVEGETLAAILKGEPDWQALPATTPPSIRFVLRRCLEKDISRRLRDAADVRIAMEEARNIGETTAPVKHRLLWLAWSAAALFCLVSLIAVPMAFKHYREKPSLSEPLRFQIALPDIVSLDPVSRFLSIMAAAGHVQTHPQD
jgi:hypothetical protein